MVDGSPPMIQVAQTLMVTIANLIILDVFCQTSRGEHLSATANDHDAPAEPTRRSLWRR